MARIRSIKPEFWTDLKLSRLSRDARLLYIALWNQADEHGRAHGDTRYVKGHCLPYDDDLSLGAIDKLLAELEDAGRVQRYEVEGDPFLYLPHLAKHQRLEAAKVPSRLPPPPEPRPDGSAPRSSARTDESAPRADTFAPDAGPSGTNVALHVAGGREQVAGGRGSARTEPRADEDTAQPVVAAYVEGARASGRPDPSGRLCGKVGRDAKRLHKEGHEWTALVTAARSMGAAGWDDLDRELQKPQRGRPVSSGQVSLSEAEYLEPGPFGKPNVVRTGDGAA